jgi:hypothetical protein
MSTAYSPMSKAVLSLPESSPAFLSQALIPSPGFNGHKPTLFVKGEGWLKTSVVNKIDEKNIVGRLPIAPEAVAVSLKQLSFKNGGSQPFLILAVLCCYGLARSWRIERRKNRA